MAVRAAIDLVVVAAFAWGVLREQPPAMPDDLCTSEEAPRVAGRLAIVVAKLGDGAHDPNEWSADVAGRYGDVVLLPDDEAQVSAAIEAALRDHEVVYYTGHNFQGRLSFAIPDEHRTLIMDTCYSTQLYGRLARDGLDLVTNDKPSITGSIETLPLLLRHASFAEINDRARARVEYRPPASKLYQAEHYRRVCVRRAQTTKAGSTAGPSRS